MTTALTAKKVSIALGSLAFDGYMIEGQTDDDGLPIFGFNLTQAAMMLGLTDEANKLTSTYSALWRVLKLKPIASKVLTYSKKLNPKG